MQTSGRIRVVVAGLTLAGALVYLVVFDLGVNAGRVHHGVSVQGIGLGGMTEADAAELLESRGDELARRPVSFGRRGLTRTLTFEPADIGWEPRWKQTLDQAMAVGREGPPLTALAERGRAWFGTAVPWAGSPKPDEMDRLLTRWERIGADAGLTIDRAFLRYKIRRILSHRPRQSLYRVPLVGDPGP